MILGAQTTTFRCSADIFANRILPAIQLIDTLHVSLTGISHIDLSGSTQSGEITTVSTDADAAVFLRFLYGLYFIDVADKRLDRLKIGEVSTVSMARLGDVLFALSGALMMLRPSSEPSIDRSVLNGGSDEHHVHFGAGIAKKISSVQQADLFSNSAHKSKVYRCVLSVPKAAIRIDRMRAVLQGSTLDGLLYSDRKGSPIPLGDRYILIISVSNPSITPRRLYQALVNSGAIDVSEAPRGLNHVDPFAKRGTTDVAFNIFLEGSTKGLWRLYGSTAEQKLTRAIIDV